MENNKDSVKGRFTSYFATSLVRAKGNYLWKQYEVMEKELPVETCEEKGDYELKDILLQIGATTDKIFDGVVGMKRLLDQIADHELICALTMLSEQQKSIILLRIFYEKSFADIGEILNIPRKKAENTYFNAIKKIRKVLGGKENVF